MKLRMPKMSSLKKLVLGFYRDEGGMVLIFTLVLILIGSLMMPPLLSLSISGLKAGQVFERKTGAIHAADSGLEYALWQIKYGDMETLFTSPAYDIFDYETTWTADLPEQVNDTDVGLAIENVWIPTTFAAPDKETARAMIETGKLIVFTSTPDISTCQTEIVFYPDIGDDLSIETLGVWLSPGFEYVPGSSSYGNPATLSHAGGQVVLWSFTSEPFEDFPGVVVDNWIMRSTITFQYTSSHGSGRPEALSWITTSGVSDVPYTWDADCRVYHITSTAGDTTAEAYNVKSELRKLGSAVTGDYFATGNTLLTPTGDVNYRNRLYRESSATVAADDIPADAIIEAVYLYWSGWIDWAKYTETQQTLTTMFEDDCGDLDGWDAGSDWSASSGEFVAHHSGGDADRYLTLLSSIDVSSYVDSEVVVSWNQSEDGSLESYDRLYFAFSGDNGDTWSDNIQAFRNDNPDAEFSYTVPVEYITDSFKFRLYLYGFADSGEYCYIDDIAITEQSSGLKYPLNDSAENVRALVEDIARVNCVDFNDTEIVADDWHILETMDLPGDDTYHRRWSYSAFYDATDLVLGWIDNEEIAENGAGQYTVGHVIHANEENPDFSESLYPSGDTGYPLATPAQYPYPSRHQFCYGGWSVILVYSSTSTEGRQIYLFDNYLIEGWHNDPDFDGDGNPGGVITGFLIPEDIAEEGEAAKLTVFVGDGDNGMTGDRIKVNDVSLWNSASPSYNVWNSDSPGLSVPGVDIDTFEVTYPTLGPGDTTADINLPTDSDGFIIVYIILSFRSDITTGGAISYLLEP